MSLADGSAKFAEATAAAAAGTKTDARSEGEMLAAIAANTAPRDLARVGPKENFTKWSTFGRGDSDFIFATEPADLLRCAPIEAMVKVGWTEPWVNGKIGAPIAVCGVDTSTAIQGKDADGNPVDKKMQAGTFEWNDLIPKATSDAKFIKGFKDLGGPQVDAVLGAAADDARVAALLGELLTACSETPVGGQADVDKSFAPPPTPT